MWTLLFVLFVWLPLAVFINNSASLIDAPFIKAWKHILFHIARLPLTLSELLTIVAHKYSGLSLFERLGKWLKS